MIERLCRRPLAVLLAVAVAAVLAAGCSSGSSSPTEPGGLREAEIEAESLRLINGSRQQAGAQRLAIDEVVAEVARSHSRAMRDHNFFGHRDPQGNHLRDRLRAAGVSFRGAAENLALVTDRIDPAGSAHQLLMDSAEHRDNILDPRFRRAGVGVARDGDTVWLTQIFIIP